MVYVLKIKNKQGIPLREIEKHLKTEFKNYDYMIGFLDGYLFDYYRIVTLDVFEKVLNHNYYDDDIFIKFITVKEE